MYLYFPDLPRNWEKMCYHHKEIFLEDFYLLAGIYAVYRW